MRPKGTIKALLVESDAGAAARIQEMLSAGAACVVHWAGTLEKALDRVARSHYDVVLLSLSLPDGAGLTGFARLRETAPAVPVVVLNAVEDDALALRVVRAGAEDFLVTGTLDEKLLAKAVRYSVERFSRRRVRGRRSGARGSRGRVLGFLGAKGGVGTTTVALNTGAALAAAGHKTLVAELRDRFGTLAGITSRVTPRGNIATLLALEPDAINPFELNARITPYSSELGFLYGPQRASEQHDLEPGHSGAIIGALACSARFTVLDLPPEPSPANREAVRQCDFLGLVVDREKASVAAARMILGAVRSWGAGAVVGLIVTQRSPLACPYDLDQITKETGAETTELIPPAADSCAMAAQAGVPAIEVYNDTLLAASYASLAAKLSAEPLLARKTA